MTKKFWGIALISMAIMGLQGCKHDPDPIINDAIITSDVCQEDTVYFQNDILPLLLGTCGTTGCHDLGSYKHGVVLVDYLSVMRTGGINLGNPASSDIYHVLGGGDESMPPSPNPQWTESQKMALLTWISQGAINNECLNQAICDTTNVTFSANVWPTIQTNCTGCHSGANPGAGIQLTNHQTISAAAATGNLYGSVAHLSGYASMPKNAARLGECDIAGIRIWIENGTPND